VATGEGAQPRRDASRGAHPRLPSLHELASAPETPARPRRWGRGGELGASSPAMLGGKGSRLVWLVRHGFQVPEARVLAADVFDQVARETLPPGHDVRSLLRLAGTREGVERAGRARARLREATLPAWLEDELARVWAELGPTAPWGLAVRSSATCEDGTVTSLAGLATSVLGVRGEAALQGAIREVWASLVLPRALEHLAQVGIHGASMAVVIQRVVEADASGVATVAEPDLFEPTTPREKGAKGDKKLDKKHDRKQDAAHPPPPPRPRDVEILVNATLGLGAPVVSGHESPDVLRLRARVAPPSVDPATGGELPARAERVEIVDRTIARKARALVVDPGDAGEARAIDVEPSRAEAPALSPADLDALAGLCARLISLGRGPWELEFAIHAGALWIVQARPVVEAGKPEGGEDDTVWSCANLAEALPGVATPLTWSVAASFSELGFRRAFAALGAVVPRGTRFVANVHGRFYLNLTAFMRVAATVPGLDPAIWLELGGGGHGDGASLLATQVQDVSRAGFYARLPLTAARFVREQVRLDQDLESYEAEATRARAAFEALDLGILTDDGVATTIRDLQRSLDRTGALMLTCASNALGSFVALKTLIARTDRANATRLAEDLTTGGALKGWGELESARPTIALVRVAEIALDDAPARAALLASPTPSRLEDVPAGATRDALQRWLAAYGDRAVREAELGTPRWREDPSFPLQTLAIYVRLAAEGRAFAPPLQTIGARADDAMRALEARLSFVERTALRHLIARAQKFARHRERMRAWVTWVLGAIRVAALEADRRLARRDPALNPGDVFFCTVDEVLATLRGEPRSIGRIVALRRAEHARDLARPEPVTTFVGRPSPVRLESLGGPVLRGNAASPGVVRGPVRVLASPSEAHRLRPGDVLVTRTTDVGWTPLFLAAAGVVTELGGPLSHAAIVARELGVPCVVNAAGATARLREGQIVRLDGDRGVVEQELPQAPVVDGTTP
jgi:pyruvate,water dikinase